MQVYQLIEFESHRQPSVTAPELAAALPPLLLMEKYAHQLTVKYWGAWMSGGGYTNEVFRLTMLRTLLKFRFTYGFTSEAAFFWAEKQAKWIQSSVAASFAVPALTVFIGGLAAIGVYKFFEWLEGDIGRIRFYPERLLLRYENQLWWGAMVWHKAMCTWWLQACQPIPISSFRIVHFDDKKQGGHDTFYFDGVWQTLAKGWVFYYVYSWNMIKVRYLGLAHHAEPGFYEMYFFPRHYCPYEQPIGWFLPWPGACDWPDKFEDYWMPYESAAPLL